MDSTRSRWDRYWQLEPRERNARSGAWLERWSDRLRSPVLEVGCGRGVDTPAIAALGHRLIALDFSLHVLAKLRARVPQASPVACDLRDGLPFAAGTFGTVVASLSLHYFDTATTHAIVRELARCADRDGALIARVNSTEDGAYGAVGHPELEPHLYRVEDRLKRFFDAADVERFFAGAWRLEHVEKVAIAMRPTKHAWLIVGSKRPASAQLVSGVPPNDAR